MDPLVGKNFSKCTYHTKNAHTMDDNWCRLFFEM